jgi:hypothetical protein
VTEDQGRGEWHEAGNDFAPCFMMSSVLLSWQEREQIRLVADAVTRPTAFRCATSTTHSTRYPARRAARL